MRVRLGKDRSRTKQVSKREWLKRGAEKAEVERRWGESGELQSFGRGRSGFNK